MGQTPLVSEYIAELVSLFEVVKSKLKDKGSVWVNIGDTYAVPMKAGCRNGQGVGQGDQIHYPERKGVLGIQPSSLVGIPARFQIAERHGQVIKNIAIPSPTKDFPPCPSPVNA
jgi:site-specific DNA-methyltransferase (cytosine-N4-specific)